MKTINLIPVKWSKTGRESLIKKRLYLANSILSAVGILLLFAGGLFYFWKNTEYRTMVAKTAKVEESLSQLSVSEKDYYLLKSELASVVEIRKINANAFFFLFRDLLLSSEAQPFLSEYEISASSSKVTLVFPDAEGIDSFLTAINQYGFKSVIIDSLEKDTGTYKMKLAITN